MSIKDAFRVVNLREQRDKAYTMVDTCVKKSNQAIALVGAYQKELERALAMAQIFRQQRDSILLASGQLNNQKKRR